MAQNEDKRKEELIKEFLAGSNFEGMNEIAQEAMLKSATVYANKVIRAEGAKRNAERKKSEDVIKAIIHKFVENAKNTPCENDSESEILQYIFEIAEIDEVKLLRKYKRLGGGSKIDED